MHVGVNPRLPPPTSGAVPLARRRRRARWHTRPEPFDAPADPIARASTSCTLRRLRRPPGCWLAAGARSTCGSAATTTDPGRRRRRRPLGPAPPHPPPRSRRHPRRRGRRRPVGGGGPTGAERRDRRHVDPRHRLGPVEDRRSARRADGGSWIDSGAVAADDPALWSASTELLLVAEHVGTRPEDPLARHRPLVRSRRWRQCGPGPPTRRFEWAGRRSLPGPVPAAAGRPLGVLDLARTHGQGCC